METAGVGHNTSHETHKPLKKTEEHHDKPPVEHKENKDTKKTDGNNKKTQENHDTHETHKTEPPKKPEPHHETHSKGKSHEGDHLGTLVDVAA